MVLADLGHHIKAHKCVGHADIVGHIASAMPVLVRFDSLQMCFYMVLKIGGLAPYEITPVMEPKEVSLHNSASNGLSKQACSLPRGSVH